MRTDTVMSPNQLQPKTLKFVNTIDNTKYNTYITTEPNNKTMRQKMDKSFTFRISPYQKNQLEKASEKCNVTQTAFVREAIERLTNLVNVQEKDLNNA